ncbi:MAG: hypothetical protein E7571_01810 [Ruminococcaceae bacterium]|nr:hypothetical protein [Oscillospiraceae bacterium]
MADSSKLAKRIIIICVVLLLVFACSVVVIIRSQTGKKEETTAPQSEVTISDEEAEAAAQKALEEYANKNGESITDGLKYYARDGKVYASASEVPFYDRDGNVYFYMTDEQMHIYFLSDKTGEKLDSSLCFVDEDGYFVYNSDGKIILSEDGFSATDEQGNRYLPAALAIWNKDGQMNVFD